MKPLSSSRALALIAVLVAVPILTVGASSAVARVCENYTGPTTNVPAQINEPTEPRGPHRPPHHKPTDPSATPAAPPVAKPTPVGTPMGTPAPRPTCAPKPKKTPTAVPTTTPTGSANYS